VLADLSEHASARSYERNQLLFSQGDPSSELFVVQRGRIAIATHAPDGRESVVVVLEDGGLFGELGLFDGGPRSADARALVESEVIVLEYEHVRIVLESRPELLWLVVRLFAQRLRATDEALADAVFLDVPGRTAKRLLELAAGRDEFRLPVTQEELAGMVGASRERVNKALALFSRLGWIEVQGRGRYNLVDRAALEDRATL
jgi:CRP-like cAMP-binding protein